VSARAADTITVKVNRGDLYAVEAPGSFETTGSFRVRLRNHGEPVHVHLRLDDALSEAVRLPTGNLYVEADGEREILLESTGLDRKVTGTLEVATGYGREQSAVEVTVRSPSEAEVTVDQTLSEPGGVSDGGSAQRSNGSHPNGASARLPALRENLAAAALGALGVLLLVIGTALLAEDLVIALGVIALLVAVGGALYYLR
jgi:hypothetical protein